MNTPVQSTEILIVGAGMSGLAAASSLTKDKHRVLLIDKSPKIGGRLASKKIGLAQFDYGAQFMTAREPRFLTLMEHCERLGLLKQWFTSRSGEKQKHPRWCGRERMTAIAEHLATSMNILLAHTLELIEKTPDGWLASVSTGEVISAKAILLTPPVPQVIKILDTSKVSLTDSVRKRLELIQYDKCIAVLASLRGPSSIDPPGGFAMSQGPISWLADNQRKGISKTPAVTLHGSATFSEEHWHTDRHRAGQLLLEAADSWLGEEVEDFQVHGWRFAKPNHIDPERCIPIIKHPPLVIAGDAFGSPRVEGAAMSGWSAASMLSSLLKQ